MTDRQMTEFLDGVVYVVEANSYEKMCLWKEHHQERGRPWKDRADGLGETIGLCDGRPVFLSLFTAEVDGRKLLFVDPTSQVVDHQAIDQWLDKSLPSTARREDGRVNKTDAMNFHLVLR